MTESRESRVQSAEWRDDLANKISIRASASPSTVYRLPSTFFRARKGGYTLVELLVTITIISIIAGFALGGLFAAQEAARRDRTRGIISKLHGQLMLRWETYETRRVPITRMANVPGLNRPETPQEFATRRLVALRELMRLELPDRWSDVADPTTAGQPVQLTMFKSLPALAEAYWRNYQRNVEPITGMLSNPTTDFQGAECLFMILSMGHDDALGTDRINLREVGDVDRDGMQEFLDGWGRPIQYLRWAPGYLPPPEPGHENETAAPALPDMHPIQTGSLWPRADTTLQTGDPLHDPDPFDFRGVDVPKTPSDPIRGYRLFPLIYSAGADGKYDITGGGSTSVFISNNDPYERLTANYQGTDYQVLLGAPTDVDDDGTFNHLDNLTNHQLEAN